MPRSGTYGSRVFARKEVKYFKYKRVEHTQKHCARNDSHIALTQDQDHSILKFIKKVTIDGKYFMYELFDSGAAECIIKESIAKKYNLKIYSCNKSLTGFGNGKNIKPIAAT